MVGGIGNQTKIINHSLFSSGFSSIRQTYQTDLEGYCFN